MLYMFCEYLHICIERKRGGAGGRECEPDNLCVDVWMNESSVCMNEVCVCVQFLHDLPNHSQELFG